MVNNNSKFNIHDTINESTTGKGRNHTGWEFFTRKKKIEPKIKLFLFIGTGWISKVHVPVYFFEQSNFLFKHSGFQLRSNRDPRFLSLYSSPLITQMVKKEMSLREISTTFGTLHDWVESYFVWWFYQI